MQLWGGVVLSFVFGMAWQALTNAWQALPREEFRTTPPQSCIQFFYESQEFDGTDDNFVKLTTMLIEPAGYLKNLTHFAKFQRHYAATLSEAVLKALDAILPSLKDVVAELKLDDERCGIPSFLKATSEAVAACRTSATASATAPMALWSKFRQVLKLASGAEPIVSGGTPVRRSTSSWTEIMRHTRPSSRLWRS